MTTVWEKIKTAWPYIWAVLKLVPRFLFKTKTGRVLVTLLLVKLGLDVDEQTIRDILELIAAGLSIEPTSVTPLIETVKNTNIPSVAYEYGDFVIGAYGTLFANETRKTIKDELSARLAPVLPPTETPVR